MSDNQEKLTERDFKDPYEYGFETEIDSDFAPKGLNEEIVKFISNKKNEPKWLLDWRLGTPMASIWHHPTTPGCLGDLGTLSQGSP